MYGKRTLFALLLFCFLTSLLRIRHIVYSQQIPPPLATPTLEEKKVAEQVGRKMWKNDFAKVLAKNFFLLNSVNNPKKPYQLASRAGSYKPDAVVTNFNVTARSIWPAMKNQKTDWPFLEAEWYKSFFSVAVDFDGLNKIIKKCYPSQRKPKIMKGAILYLMIYDPKTEKNIYAGWFKANTDSRKDLNPSANTSLYAENKICLAVDSADLIKSFQGKKATVQFFCSGQIPTKVLKKAKVDQGTIERSNIKF